MLEKGVEAKDVVFFDGRIQNMDVWSRPVHKSRHRPIRRCRYPPRFDSSSLGDSGRQAYGLL
jgi:hypothetical protein